MCKFIVLHFNVFLIILLNIAGVLLYQVGENEPFVSELLTGLPNTIADLEPHQIHSFYESVSDIPKCPSWSSCSLVNDLILILC